MRFRSCDARGRGWFALHVPESVVGEIIGPPESPHRGDKYYRALEHPVPIAPFRVFGFSILGGSRSARPGELREYERLFGVLFPQEGSRDPQAKSYPSNRADTAHVYNALRNGARAFVTLDGSGKGWGLLDAAPDVNRELDGFLILSPAQALDRVRRDIAKWYELEEKRRRE